MQAESIEPAGLTGDDAIFVGMSRRSWDELWKSGGAPDASRPFAGARNPRWSKDELRAWVAWGYPAIERWRPIWAKLLESGAWSPSEIVIREKGPTNAA